MVLVVTSTIVKVFRRIMQEGLKVHCMLLCLVEMSSREFKHSLKFLFLITGLFFYLKIFLCFFFSIRNLIYLLAIIPVLS